MHFTIEWCYGDAKGYTDYLPEEWFRQEGEFKGCDHEILGPQGGISEAKCDLNVKGSEANLDYTKYAEPNKKVIVGTMKLIFENDLRRRIGKVLWKDEGGKEFVHCPVGSEVILGKDDDIGVKGKYRKPNPSWTRDELILALDLYLKHRKQIPGKSSTVVLELSDFLNRLGKALGNSKGVTYRNSNGVYMKLMNFRRFDPEYIKDGKVGLTRGNKDEEAVWNEFSSDPPRLENIVQAIKETTDKHISDGELFGEEPEIQEAEEGRVLTRLHRFRERKRGIIESKKKDFLRTHKRLFCEACGFDFSKKYGPDMKGVIDVHHTKPIHTLSKEEKTQLKDLILLCPNCHRVVHSSRKWLTIEQVKELLAKANGR